MNNISIKKRVFLASGIIVLMLLVTVVGLLTNRRSQPTREITDLPTMINPNEVYVSSISPSESTPLSVGNPQLFTLVLSEKLALEQVNIQMTRIDITKDNTSETIPIALDKESSGDRLMIKTQDSIKPFSRYDLLVSDKHTGSVIYRASFNTIEPYPSPNANNDPTLRNTLPYQTKNYRLEYLDSRNIYVFHFIFDSSSNLNADTQFENAKNDALKYIDSRGVNIDSIVIEWRYN